MIIPAVVIMAAAPVMVQAAGYQIPANATCVDGKALKLTGTFTFNNLDFIEIHYTTNRTENANKINVTVGSETYSESATLKGSEYVVKFLVKATNLTVPEISVSIEGAGSIVVTSASATTGVYQGLVTKYEALVKKLTALKEYPFAKKVDQVYDTADIEKLAQDLGNFKAELEDVYAEGVETDAEGLYTTLANNLDYDNRASAIKADIDKKAKAIADANKAVADAISAAETELNNTNTTLRNTYSLYTNDLARALQDIQKQRTALTKIKSDNAASLTAQTSDTDKETLLASVEEVKAALAKIKSDIATAKVEKDNAYEALVAQVAAVRTQNTDQCPKEFATLKATDFSAELKAISDKVVDARYKDAVTSLNIDADINAYNAKIDLFNVAVVRAKAVKEAYNTAYTCIKSMPKTISDAKTYINGLETRGTYSDNTNGLTYDKTLNLNGKGGELLDYEKDWNQTSGNLFSDLLEKYNAEKAYTYDVLGAENFASEVEAAKTSIESQKDTDTKAIEALKTTADDLIKAYNEVFGRIHDNAEKWSEAVNDAKGLLMYDKTGYTGYKDETKSYAAQLAEQKTAIDDLVQKVATAASTTKTIAAMLTDVKALENTHGPSDWETITAAIKTLYESTADRELAFKGDDLVAAKKAAEDVWPTYTEARTNDDFLAPTSVHQTVQETLQDQYDALVKQYEDYQGYKNATVDATDYGNQLANFKKVSEGASKFAADVDAYIKDLKKAQTANSQNGTLYEAARKAVGDAQTALVKTADNTQRKYRWESDGKFYGTGKGSVPYETAEKYKKGRVATLSNELNALLAKIDAANTACTLYDEWGHDNVKGTLQTRYEALNGLIGNVDKDIDEAIKMQETANALELASLKKGKENEVVGACTDDFNTLEGTITKIKNDLQDQIAYSAIDKWATDYKSTFDAAVTSFGTSKTNLQNKLEGYQTQFNDRKTLSTLVAAAKTKIDAAWISSDYDAIEYYNEQLFTIEGKINELSTFVGTDWAAGTNYTEKLNTVKSDLEKYAAAATVAGSIDTIVAASKANLAAKGVLEEKAAKLTQQLKHTIELLKANKIEVTVDGVTTVKERTFETDAEKAKQKVALENLEAFFNEKGEISDANVDFSGKSVDTEIADRYALGQAATNQAKVENGILAFYTAINNVMVNLDNDYIGIVNGANEAVKTAFGTAYAAHDKAYKDAIAELGQYQNLPAGDFRDQVMATLTEAVTKITAQKSAADAQKNSFDADDQSLYDTDGYYNKNESAKAFIESCTTEIVNILSNFTTGVNELAVSAFDTELRDAKSAYDEAKAVLDDTSVWTVTTNKFADVKKLIDDVEAAFTAAPTALNYAAQVNALKDNIKGYAARIAADKSEYANKQVDAYKQIGKEKIAAAKKTIQGYTHLTSDENGIIANAFDALQKAYEDKLIVNVTDLWKDMATVKNNSTDWFLFKFAPLYAPYTIDITNHCKRITDKALVWDTTDWNTTVCSNLKAELAKVNEKRNALRAKNYDVLNTSTYDSEWETEGVTGQKKSDLEQELTILDNWYNAQNTELGNNHDREWLAAQEKVNGTIRTDIASKLDSFEGDNGLNARVEAANTAYTNWKNNKALNAYKQIGLASPAFALAESWIPQNYNVADTEDYLDIVARVEAVKKAIAYAESAEEVDYYAFGKVTEGATFEGENIPALLVVIDNHNENNNLVAGVGEAVKTAIEGFEAALAAEKDNQADYEDVAKSNFGTIETDLANINASYEAALGNGTLVFSNVQKEMTDKVAKLQSDLSTLATNAANTNTIAVKTNNNQAGMNKVQDEYDAFVEYYNAACEELEGYADVMSAYTKTLEGYHNNVSITLLSAKNTYDAFVRANDKLNATGLAENATIADVVNANKKSIEKLLSIAKAAQHAYDVEQAKAELNDLYAPVAEYWKTAQNTLTSYDTTVQDSFAEEEQAVVAEMVAVEDGIYYLTYESLSGVEDLKAKINGLKAQIDALLDLAAKNNVGAVGTGDVEADGIVDLDDYELLLNYILDKQEFTEEQEKAADVNRDGRVNVADLQGVLNIYHYGAWNRTSHKSNSRHRVAAYLNAAADNMEAEISGAQGVAEIALNLDNRQAYTSFQFDVKLPEGMQFDLVSLTERAEGLDVQTGLLADGTIRVVATATDASIEAGTGAVARLNIATEGITDGEIVIDNIVFADNFANAKTFDGFALTAGTVTGIAGNASLTQRVVRSIYNAGGQLMDKVQQGINILVGEDGTAKKVIKK